MYSAFKRMFFKKPDEPAPPIYKIKLFLATHWRGILSVITPMVFLPIVVGSDIQRYHWTAYCLLVMAVYWVAECIPLAVTAFIPIVLFPFVKVMDTNQVCECFCSDTIMMFLGSLFLAAAIEQCGLHMRLAYCAIRTIGYSHYKLLLAMCIVTTFVSMWITNTAATTMMVPINHALLNVFDGEKILKKYVLTKEGNEIASPMTVCYFCAATYSATIGGIGTLVGTGTNLVFKGFFQRDYPTAPEYLSFPKFSAHGIPYMICMEASLYLILIFTFFGFMRPKSEAAKQATITPLAQTAAKKTIADKSKALGSLTYWEASVIVLFGGAMVGFFCRSPQMFMGWGDAINAYYLLNNPKFAKDSAMAMLATLLMLLLPSNFNIFKNFTVRYHEDLPKTPVKSVLCWRTLNATVPFSFCYLLGGGFALSTASKVTGLNDKLGEEMIQLKPLPNSVILLCVITIVTIVTNVASNIVVCNVFTPIAIELAKQINQNPLMYTLASGLAASYAFMIPVGTPGNLIVQGSAKITTTQMIRAGWALTIVVIFITWLSMMYWAPIIWPDIRNATLPWIGIIPVIPEEKPAE